MNRNSASQKPWLEQVESLRLEVSRRLEPERQSEWGQFFSSMATARRMAAMFEGQRSSVRLLDAGAGIGCLSAAYVERVCRSQQKPKELSITAYELDPWLAEPLRDTLNACHAECQRAGIQFSYEVLQKDFIETVVLGLEGGHSGLRRFDCAILNPPYRKIHSRSEARQLLSRVGIETSNLYTAFLWLTCELLGSGGELVAITPRSFCNGPYFRNFRQAFLDKMSLRQIHVFEARDRAFREDEVLQENIIFQAIQDPCQRGQVVIMSSADPEDKRVTTWKVDYNQLVRPEDPNRFIHIVTDDLGRQVAEQMQRFSASLADLDLTVSTGRVVDFRAASFLRQQPEPNTVPLIYPGHFANGWITWPKLGSKKPNAVVASPQTDSLLVPPGVYVLVKRFSAKEERRRIVAAIYDPERLSASKVGFENHLNYYHCNGKGLPMSVAKGLVLFLNSTLVDAYFRQFNGHTQVNAADLRNLPYPGRAQLEYLGQGFGHQLPGQADIDRSLERHGSGSPENCKAGSELSHCVGVGKGTALN